MAKDQGAWSTKEGLLNCCLCLNENDKLPDGGKWQSAGQFPFRFELLVGLVTSKEIPYGPGSWVPGRKSIFEWETFDKRLPANSQGQITFNLIPSWQRVSLPT